MCYVTCHCNKMKMHKFIAKKPILNMQNAFIHVALALNYLNSVYAFITKTLLDIVGTPNSVT